MIIILIQNSMMIQYNDFLSNMVFNKVLLEEEFFPFSDFRRPLWELKREAPRYKDDAGR